MVVAGLMIGNQGRILAMSEKTEEHLDSFWELIDEILNAILFLVIGLEILVLAFQMNHIIFGLSQSPDSYSKNACRFITSNLIEEKGKLFQRNN